MSKTPLEKCFIYIQTPQSWSQKTWLRLIQSSISAHFSVSGYRMKHCVLFFMYYVKYLSFSSLIRQLHFFQVNPNIKFEVFIHKVDGLSDDHKIGGFNLALVHVVANWLHLGSQIYYCSLWILCSKLKIPFLREKKLL